jgi:hypothetical protein
MEEHETVTNRRALHIVRSTKYGHNSARSRKSSRTSAAEGSWVVHLTSEFVGGEYLLDAGARNRRQRH